MISIDCNFESVILRTQVNVKVYLPNPENFMHPVSDYKKRYSFAPFKTLFLLHGLMDSGQQWIENTNIVRLAQEADIALVIPSCGNNFYINTISGLAYADFISKELVGFVRAMFPLSDKREDNFLWGISMGGYGALRMGFMEPDLFSRIIAMSPTTDIVFTARFADAMGVKPDYIIGNWRDLKGSDYDLEVLAERAGREGVNIPEMFLIIAEDDHMVRDNSKFRQILEDYQLPHKFCIYPGDHTWSFWSRHIEEGLLWLKGEADE